jgi:hypothetical protein
MSLLTLPPFVVRLSQLHFFQEQVFVTGTQKNPRLRQPAPPVMLLEPRTFRLLEFRLRQ